MTQTDSKTAQLYNDALRSSGYNENIQYVKNHNQGTNKNKNRSRNIISFNLPYSQNVETNVAKSFLSLIDKHFPKSHKLHKIFNRNNVKVSYSCTTNMGNIIKSHNRKILNEGSEPGSSQTRCNCRNKDLCPLDGKCLTNNVIYEATVTTTSGITNTYIGMTENDFKTRYNNHKLSFNRKHSHDTVLSKRIWELKDTNTSYNLKWCIIKRANAYNGNPSLRNLCLSEKLCILNIQDVSLFNKKSELVTKCRHENKLFATNHRKRRANRN